MVFSGFWPLPRVGRRWPGRKNLLPAWQALFHGSSAAGRFSFLRALRRPYPLIPFPQRQEGIHPLPWLGEQKLSQHQPAVGEGLTTYWHGCSAAFSGTALSSSDSCSLSLFMPKAAAARWIRASMVKDGPASLFVRSDSPRAGCCTTCVSSCAVSSRSVGAMAGTEVDVRAVGEGLGSDGLIHLPSIVSRMHMYVAEVHTESRLHVGAHRTWQWTSASFAEVDPLLDIDVRFKGAAPYASSFCLDRVRFFSPLQWRFSAEGEAIHGSASPEVDPLFPHHCLCLPLPGSVA